jgi:hypothetical protein
MYSQSKLQPVPPDSIYNLLPAVIRANDPNGAIESHMVAQATEHNFFLKKMAGLPCLQDPTLAGKFTPEDFNEDPAEFARYLVEIKKDRKGLTVEELENLDTLIAQLEERVPKSVQAYKLQNRLLNLLASTVGARIYNKYYVATNRQLIETAIARHHIKGTHASVHILGRILGLIDLKVRELWSRFTIKDPSEPGNALNDFDFADLPDEYPYWPLGEHYDGVTTRFTERGDATSPSVVTPNDEVMQLPLPSGEYNPNLLDDFVDANGEKVLYEVKFEGLEVNPLGGRYYLDLINGHNPFGNFQNEIDHLLKPGTYYLSGGNEIKLARAVIPYDFKSGVKEILAVRAGINHLILTLDKVSTELHVSQPIYLTGTNGFDDFYTIKALATVDGKWEVTIAYKGALMPKVGSLGHLTFSEYGFTIFEALAYGNWANGVELAVLPDSNGGQIVRLIGPQSKIKFKSSFFDLVLSADLSLFPSLYPCQLVEPCFNGSLDDLNVTTNHTFEITGIDSTLISARFPRLSLAVPTGEYPTGTVGGLTPGTLVSLQNPNLGDPAKLYVVTEVDPVNNAVIVDLGHPEAPVVPVPTPGQSPVFVTGVSGTATTGYGKLTFGRVAGDLPVTGSLTGERQIADPSTLVVDFLSFSELIASLRELFEELRPVTRTQRLSRTGFLLKDQMVYAPYYIKDHVILQSDEGVNYRLRADQDGRIWWEEVAADLVPTRIIQHMVKKADDPRTSVLDNTSYVEWQIRRNASDQPEFFTIPSVGAKHSDIVYITDGVTEAIDPDGNVVEFDGLSPTSTVLYRPTKFTGFQGYIATEGGRLVAYHDLPDQLRSIHEQTTDADLVLWDSEQTPVESLVSTDKGLVAENQPSLADCMSPDAQTTDRPSEAFRFNERPEDDVDLEYGVGDGLRTMLPNAWLPETDDTMFKDEAWRYHFADGSFEGRDLRTRSTGVLPNVVHPLPGDLIYLGYPIRHMDLSGKMVWRDRVTNVPHVSFYYLGDITLDDNDPPGDPAVDDIPTRVDYVEGSLSYGQNFQPIHNGATATADGQIDYSGSSTGYGVTPNGQAWGTLDRIWQDKVARDFESPAPYTSVVNAGDGKAQLNMVASNSLLIGMPIRIASGPYAGTHKILDLDQTGETMAVKLSASYVSDDSGTLALRLCSMQMWEKPRDLTLTIKSDATSTGPVTYKVYTSAYNGTGEALVASGSVAATTTSVTTVTVNNGLVYVELSAASADQLATVRLERLATDAPILRSAFANGKRLWGDGRDAVELFILEDGNHFWNQVPDYEDNSLSELSETHDRVTYDPNSIGPINSWRGGGWRSVISANVTARGALPGVLAITEA